MNVSETRPVFIDYGANLSHSLLLFIGLCARILFLRVGVF